MKPGEEWLSRAACGGHRDPSLWEVDHAIHRDQFDRCAKCVAALRVCHACPVQRQCAESAARREDTYMLRGGWALIRAKRVGAIFVRPAVRCNRCALPVLRGYRTRFCSTLCARRCAAMKRADARATVKG